MTNDPINDPIDDLSAPLRPLRERFDALIAPYRAVLWRYCLELTGSAWDAEELLQDSVARAFARLPYQSRPIDARRSLFRDASLRWLDALRHAERGIDPIDESLAVPPDTAADAAEARDTAGLRARMLPPRQRIIVLVIDEFGFRPEEVASMLASTSAAITAALHRARATLRAAAGADRKPRRRTRARSPIDPNALAAFVDALNRRDAETIEALLHDDVVVEHVGAGEEWGREAVRRGSLAAWNGRDDALSAEEAVLDGRNVVYIYRRTTDHDRVLDSITALETAGGRITALRVYAHSPELIRYAGDQLGVPAGDRAGGGSNRSA